MLALRRSPQRAERSFPQTYDYSAPWNQVEVASVLMQRFLPAKSHYFRPLIDRLLGKGLVWGARGSWREFHFVLNLVAVEGAEDHGKMRRMLNPIFS